MNWGDRSSLILSLHPTLGFYKKDGDKPFSRDRTRVDGFKLKEDILAIRTFFFYNEGGVTLAQVAQRGGGFPLLGIFKARSNLVQLQVSLSSPFSPNPSMIPSPQRNIRVPPKLKQRQEKGREIRDQRCLKGLS